MGSETGAAPVLSVCLVNYNDEGHLAACLDSIEADARDIPHEIVVVDNASSDGSVALVRGKYPGVRLLRNDRNEGFGRANNSAARVSRGEFLLFVNTDVVVRPGTLRILLDEMRGNPLTGAAGPALLNPLRRIPRKSVRGGTADAPLRGQSLLPPRQGDPKDISPWSSGPGDVYQVSFGGRTDFIVEAVKKAFLNRMRSRALGRTRSRREVGWASGAFLMVRRKAFVDAGGFDENIFLYFEDIDLCDRIRDLGCKIVFLPEAVSFHWGGAVTAGMGLRSRLEYRKSQLAYYKKHNSRISLRLLRIYIRLSFAVLSLKGAFKAEPPEVREEFRGLLKRAGE